METHIPITQKLKNFSLFYPKAKKLRFKCFVLYIYVQNAESKKAFPQVKASVVASKKGVGKKAVFRNRAKRRLKHSFFFKLATFPLPLGVEVEVVFMANRHIVLAPWSEVEQDTQSALEQILNHCLKNIDRVELNG